MPTYEYACRDCGEHVEVVQSFRDDPLTDCGICGGRLRKVFSTAGIIFKGDGYYVTDTRKKSKAASGSEGKAASGSEGKAASGSEGKAASGSEGKAASSGGSSAVSESA